MSLRTSRRTLRTATRASSAILCTSRTISFLRSSVSWGTGSRMIWPSLLGVRPRSDSMIAFSTAVMMLRSYGCTVSRRGSGALMVASWLSGVRVP